MNENRQEWRTWARVLHRWGLENAAASVLEALGPLAVVGAQLVYLTQPIASVGSWSFILARPTLDADVAYRLARALDRGHTALVGRLDQGRETTPQNTVAAAPRPDQIHAGVQKYLREIGRLP